MTLLGYLLLHTYLWSWMLNFRICICELSAGSIRDVHRQSHAQWTYCHVSQRCECVEQMCRANR